MDFIEIKLHIVYIVIECCSTINFKVEMWIIVV